MPCNPPGSVRPLNEPPGATEQVGRSRRYQPDRDLRQGIVARAGVGARDIERGAVGRQRDAAGVAGEQAALQHCRRSTDDRDDRALINHVGVAVGVHDHPRGTGEGRALGDDRRAAGGGLEETGLAAQWRIGAREVDRVGSTGRQRRSDRPVHTPEGSRYGPVAAPPETATEAICPSAPVLGSADPEVRHIQGVVVGGDGQAEGELRPVTARSVGAPAALQFARAENTAGASEARAVK